MSVANCLKGARELLRTGWSEPFSIDERGAAGVTLKTAEKLCVIDAVTWCASTVDEGIAALSLLEATACPNAALWHQLGDRLLQRTDPALIRAWQAAAGKYDGTLQGWLEKRWRTPKHVLELFDRALVRTLKEER